MPSALDHVETIVSKTGDLIETKAELWKLKTAGKVSETFSSIISVIAIVLLFSVALIVISFGVAFWIGEELGSLYYGFFIVGGFYALVGLLVFAMRKSLIKEPISNLIIDKIIKE